MAAGEVNECVIIDDMICICIWICMILIHRQWRLCQRQDSFMNGKTMQDGQICRKKLIQKRARAGSDEEEYAHGKHGFNHANSPHLT